jgi:uncharacterized SAM-binding protein YcdF (DUF218 family)
MATNVARRRSRWQAVAIAVLVLGAGLAAVTARLFVWPKRGMPEHVDSIVMLGGQGNRLGKAVQLARAQRAPYLVVSRDKSEWRPGSACLPTIPGVTVVCFTPRPFTTQGEAEFVGRLAEQYHWRSLVVVTTSAQATRARIRVERCFRGRVYVATTSLAAPQLAMAVAYEWGATLKAEVLERGC